MKRDSIKRRANCQVQYAHKIGKLIRPIFCSECGAKLIHNNTPKTIHAHHHDYDKPLEVQYLCPPCHHKRHPELGRKSYFCRRCGGHTFNKWAFLCEDCAKSQVLMGLGYSQNFRLPKEEWF